MVIRVLQQESRKKKAVHKESVPATTLRMGRMYVTIP
jgi:hypothetical protein